MAVAWPDRGLLAQAPGRTGGACIPRFAGIRDQTARGDTLSPTGTPRRSDSFRSRLELQLVRLARPSDAAMDEPAARMDRGLDPGAAARGCADLVCAPA